MPDERILHSVGEVTGEQIGGNKGAVSSHLLLSSVRKRSQPSMGTVRLRERLHATEPSRDSGETVCVVHLGEKQEG